MARTVLPIAGAIVGAYFGGAAGAQWGYAAGSLIAGAIPQQAQGPRIGETGAQTSAEGVARAIVYGTCQVTGNVIASGPLIKRDVEENQGGKGGTDVSNEHAYRTFAVRICEGPIGDILRVWQDDKLVFDIRPTSTMFAESIKWKANKNVYLGDEDQLPDPSLQMIFGVDEVPAHRASAYIVAIEDDLTDRRGSIPQYRFEVAGITQGGVVLGPLVVSDWTGIGMPIHSAGGTEYASAAGTFTDFPTAAAATAAFAAVTQPAAASSTQFIAFATSTTNLPSGFKGGAGLSDDPQRVIYKLAVTRPDVWEDPTSQPRDITYCSALSMLGAVPGDGKAYAIWEGSPIPSFSLSKLEAFTTPPDTPWSGPLNNCTNYPNTAGFPQARTNPILSLNATRVPSAPDGWTEVSGTAKQLCGVVYRSGVLYQNALGPVILPDDPRYNDAAFWDEARDSAIALGLIKSDVSYPAVVSAYAFGTHTGSGVPVELGLIVSDVHARCNFPAGQFDVSELTDRVSGLVLAGEYTGADAINTLRSLYLFDAADQDKTLVYPKRGKPVVATITEDDIVEAEESSKREQAIEYPKKLHLSYQNAVGGYAVAKATSARSSPDVRVVGEVSTSVPVVLSPDQAAQTAAIMHKIAWAEAEGETKLSVPLSWIKYIASDCFGVALRGRVTRERLDELNTADGVIEYTLRRDRQSAYTSTVTGIAIPEPTPPPSTIVGETVLAVLDISPRADNEDDLNLLYAVNGGLPAWNGATVQRSLDAGANFSSVVNINRGPVLGTLVNALPDASEFYTDTTNVLRVQLYRDTQTIESITDSQFLSEGGAFAVERPDGSWEVLQYRDADEVSAGVFDLSYLHRGQLNSGTSAHLAGALVVMLDGAVHAPAQSAWIGANLTHRAVSYGESPETADEQTQTYVGRSQTEWPVAYLQLSRDVSNNVTGTWTPRHRFGTEDSPVASVNFRGYRVTLSDGVLPPVTFDTTAQTFTYAAGALGTPLTVSVAALNRITGQGPSTSGAI